MITQGMQIVPPDGWIRYLGDFMFNRLTQAELQAIREFNEDLADKIL